MTATAVPVTTWQGCYSDGWQDLMVPEAFAHPAKFARGLIHRIYRHLIEQGYVRQGDVVLDPFGGVALGALDALTYGLRYMGVELEPRFVALGQQNLDLWRQRYGFTGGTIVQGDSRRLREVLAGAQVGCVVGSPPYMDGCIHDTGQVAAQVRTRGTTKTPWGTRAQGDGIAHYGTTPGQLGAMPPGQVGCVVGSPPWDQSLGGGNGTAAKHDWFTAREKVFAHGIGGRAGQSLNADYGTTPGQLGAMPPGALVSSPPYAGAGEVLGTHNGIDWSKAQEGGKVATPARQASGEGYGTSPGQLGAMPPGVVVSSPPYAQSHVANIDTGRIGNTPQQPVWKQTSGDYYGPSPAQLGNTAGDTFWAASAQIMQELAAILPAGAVCAWVLKAYVSKGAIVPFPDQWLALCEQHGFVTREIIHASLIEDCGTQEGLFGEAETVTVQRKSFFRRLYEKRPGAPRIDHETVLILTKE